MGYRQVVPASRGGGIGNMYGYPRRKAGGAGIDEK